MEFQNQSWTPTKLRNSASSSPRCGLSALLMILLSAPRWPTTISHWQYYDLLLFCCLPSASVAPLLPACRIIKHESDYITLQHKIYHFFPLPSVTGWLSGMRPHRTACLSTCASLPPSRLYCCQLLPLGSAPFTCTSRLSLFFITHVP